MFIVRIFPVHVHSAWSSLLSVNPVSLGGLKAGQPKPGGPALSQQQQARLLRA